MELHPAPATGLLGPRVVIAGTHSGVGKTTVATGLMAALARRGVRVAPAKAGPDFIDPGYHSLATGRPGRNLDPWLCGAGAMVPLAAQAAEGAEVLVVEGAMGLFDGAADHASHPGRLPFASTAQVAALLEAPVVLVVDASALSTSVAALVHGYASWPEGETPGPGGGGVAGVVLNRVGSDVHEALLREALAPLGLPVLGCLRRDPAMAWRDRHLGLVPVVEDRPRVVRALDRLAAAVEGQLDVGGLMALAKCAPFRRTPMPTPARPSGRARVAVMGGPAFSFAYPENLQRLAQAGAELVPLDPMEAPALPPAIDALYAGGGFPEVYLEALAANRPLLADVAARAAAGMVAWAECGGLLWLARSLGGRELCGVVRTDGRMTGRLTLGYRRARARVSSPVAPAGAELAGHELHYSVVEPPGDALELRSRWGLGAGGFAAPRLLASYLHVHLGADPAPAERFVATAARASPAARALG